MWSCWKPRYLPPLSRAKQQCQCRGLLCELAELGGCYSQYVLPPKHGGSKRSSKWPRIIQESVLHLDSFNFGSILAPEVHSYSISCALLSIFRFQQQCRLQLVYIFFVPHVCTVYICIRYIFKICPDTAYSWWHSSQLHQGCQTRFAWHSYLFILLIYSIRLAHGIPHWFLIFHPRNFAKKPKEVEHKDVKNADTKTDLTGKDLGHFVAGQAEDEDLVAKRGRSGFPFQQHPPQWWIMKAWKPTMWIPNSRNWQHINCFLKIKNITLALTFDL